MYLVRSKYKNPDKFIIRLKEDLERERRYGKEWRDEFYVRQGKAWFGYAKNIAKTDLTSDKAMKARIHQEVIVTGRVTGYTQIHKGYNVEITLKEVRLLDEETP